MNNQKLLLYIAWIQSIIATLGSLYFSDIAGYPPCKLCWYQRIFMYPLIILLPVMIMRKEIAPWHYILALTIPGWLIAAYHNLLYYHILPQSYAPCVAGISCTTKYIEYFGFVTIPLLSFTAFSIIIALTLLYRHLDLKHLPGSKTK